MGLSRIPRSPTRPLLLAFVLASSAGCATANRAYRPSTEALGVSVDELGSAEGRRRVGRTSLERHETFTLGIVEFDDQGYYWDRRQSDALIDEIRREAAGPGEPAVVVSVFVHGWRHTADVCDANLCCFREVLGDVARQQGREPGRSSTSPSSRGRTWRGKSARGT